MSVSRYGVKTLPSHPVSQGQASRAHADPISAHNFQITVASPEMHSSAPFHDRIAIGNSTRTPRKWLSPLPRALESPSANHNVVDVERIRRGQDVRTTVSTQNHANLPRLPYRSCCETFRTRWTRYGIEGMFSGRLLKSFSQCSRRLLMKPAVVDTTSCTYVSVSSV